MSKRYGRNKKRRHIEAIRSLERELYDMTVQRDKARCEIALAQDRADRAMQNALNRFVESQDLYRLALKDIWSHLAFALGNELLPHAETIMNGVARREPLISFDSITNYGEQSSQTTTIRGSIPSMHYQVVVRA